MKIILISPPRIVPIVADFPPLGLGILASVAKKEGYWVKVFDASSWKWSELIEKLQYENPDVVGITCWTIERGQAFETAKVVKSTLPNVKIIFGGPHASAFPDQIFAKTSADFVIIGEGENTFKEVLKFIFLGNNEVNKIRGIAYKQKDRVILTSKRVLMNNLDSIPWVDHEQFDYSFYKGLHDTKRKAAAIITSRGCPYKCIFCSSTIYWENKYRKRLIKDVLDEVKVLYYDFGIRSIIFFDDNLTIDRERMISLCHGLSDLKLDLTWVAEGSVKVDKELLTIMKNAGCYRIDFGVESGSLKILKNIKKPFTVDDTRRAFKLCMEVGIKPNAYLIIGSPGEDRNTVDETIKLMKEIQPEVKSVRPGMWILPNTELYTLALKKGIISESKWLLNDTLYYTAEHSLKQLQSLANQFERGMALHNGFIEYLKVITKQIIYHNNLKFIRKLLKFFLKKKIFYNSN